VADQFQLTVNGRTLADSVAPDTPVLAAKGLLDANPEPTRQEIKQALSNNLCRCGTHLRVVRAVERAAQAGSAAK